mgnify:CR=1 FL=1
MSHVSRGGEELGTVFARFIKERAELERDYAKNMRKLVNKYTDKTTESKKTRETTQARGFRWVWRVEMKLGYVCISNEITAKRFSSCHVMFLNKRLDTFIMLAIPYKGHWFIKTHITQGLVQGLAVNNTLNSTWAC